MIRMRLVSSVGRTISFSPSPSLSLRCLGTSATSDAGLDFARASLVEVSAALQSGAVSAEDLTAWSLDRSESAHAKLNCLAGSASDLAEWRARAEKAAFQAGDRLRAGKSLGPLDGVPVTVKDNFCVEGMVTTACSKVLGRWRPPFSAAAVESLETRSGAVVTGKTNQDEFG